MITIFLVFKTTARGAPADGSTAPLRLYFATDVSVVSEEDIRHEATRYGWRVIKLSVEEGEAEMLLTEFKNL